MIPSQNYFNYCFFLYQQFVTYNANLSAALNLIVFLHGINTKERKDKLHYESFHWPELADFVDVQQNYIHWLFDKTVSIERKDWPILYTYFYLIFLLSFKLA